MIKIEKIKLYNYKCFKEYIFSPNEKINIIIGDNETGKSTIIEAIDLVASGNLRKVEMLGLNNIFNVESINNYLNSDKLFDNLPRLVIELYLNIGDALNFDINGKNNTDNIVCDGIRLICEPDIEYRNEIMEILSSDEKIFPFDYYKIKFSTFSDSPYNGYKKILRTAMIDTSNMESEYATNDFIKRMYNQYTEDNPKQRAILRNEYRTMKRNFKDNNLCDLNNRLPIEKHYSFGLKENSSYNLESDLMIYENDVSLNNKGAGKQVFIKTDFALERAGSNVEAILIEEPENHLSHTNLRKLIHRISSSQNGQIFITTHSSYISTRLELNNIVILSKNDSMPILLKGLNIDTAKYFMKAPPTSIIEFVLSKKAILVEGPSEYILFEKMYKKIVDCLPEDDGVQVLDIRGLSFKRYLDIAILSKQRVAVITDNDGDFEHYILEKYKDYQNNENISIFYDNDNSKHTFECLIYTKNEELCKELFGDNALNYMLNNKTEAAYKIVCNDNDLVVPNYIKKAIEWIRK